jgi:hypothetical protein
MPTRTRRTTPRHAFAGMVAIVGLGVSTGCARRVDVNEHFFEHFEQWKSRLDVIEPEIEREVLIYPSRSFVVAYTCKNSGCDPTAARPVLRIDDTTPGRIVGQEWRAGDRVLWVGFDTCRSRECAVGFRWTVEDRFYLSDVPEHPYDPPDRYYGVDAVYDGKRLRPGHLLVPPRAGLASVYRARTGRRNRPIHLELRLQLRTVKPGDQKNAYVMGHKIDLSSRRAKKVYDYTTPKAAPPSLSANTILLQGASLSYQGTNKQSVLARCRTTFRETVFAWADGAGLLASEREVFDAEDAVRYTLRFPDTRSEGYYIVTFRFDEDRARFAFEHRATTASRDSQRQIAEQIELVFRRERWERLFAKVEESMHRCNGGERTVSG